MTEQLMKLTINCSTQQEEYVPMSAEEIAQREVDIQAISALESQMVQAAEAKATAKAAAIQKIVANTGLTQEEAEALYS